MKAIFFDIGGVVIHTNFPNLYINFAKSAGIDPDFIVEYHKVNRDDLTLGKISLEEFFETMRQKVQGRNATIEELKQAWREESKKDRVINQELLSWIDNNRKKYLIGAITNLTNSRLMLDEEMNLYSHFDISVLSCVERLKKPDPEFYKVALKKADLPASECVFVDDREDFVVGAKEVGLKDILFVNNGLLFEELRQI